MAAIAVTLMLMDDLSTTTLLSAPVYQNTWSLPEYLFQKNG